MKKLNIWLMQQLNKYLHHKNPKLFIVGGKYAYIQIDNTRYYFNPIIRKEKITTFDGTRLLRKELKYDGWEQHYDLSENRRYR